MQGWQHHFESFVADCVANRNVFVQLEDAASIVERVDDLPWRFIDCHLDEIFLRVQFVWGIFSRHDSQDKKVMCVSFVFDVFQCGSVHPVQAEMMSAAPFAQLHEGFVNRGRNSPCFGSLVLLVGVGGDQSSQRFVTVVASSKSFVNLGHQVVFDVLAQGSQVVRFMGC